MAAEIDSVWQMFLFVFLRQTLVWDIVFSWRQYQHKVCRFADCIVVEAEEEEEADTLVDSDDTITVSY